MEATQQTLPILDEEEIRILGALIEKSKATPEYYPMTINGLTAACNQKTSRKPVVQYDEQTVTLALDRLKKKGLVATATGGSSRSVKYKHNFALVYQMMPDELAVICLLLLRGPQTPGELNTNSGRLYEFESLEEVHAVLEKLSSGELQFLMQLPRQAGQKEARYMHLLGKTGDELIDYYQHEESASTTMPSNVETRLATVEQELAELKAAFEQLMKELT
mgnify:CR=1 FL=1